MAAPVYATLIASGAVTALVSTRIYPDAAPQDSAKPYITFSDVGGIANNYLGDVPGIDNPVVQIEITALTSASREAIKNAVIDHGLSFDLQYVMRLAGSDHGRSYRYIEIRVGVRLKRSTCRDKA